MSQPSLRRPWPIRAALLALALSARAGAADGAAAPPSDGAAQRVTEAEALAERAYRAYVARDYAVAVALYHQAFERAPSADALFNIARIYDLGLRDRTLAISFYRRYLSDPGALPERIERANMRLSALRLAEQAELAAPPEPAPAPRALTPEPEPNAAGGRDGLSGWQIAGITLGTTGAIATGVGAVYGVTVLSEADRANADCDGGRCRSQAGIDAARAASRHATVATWAIGAGTGLLATGVLLWVLDPEGATPRPEARVEPIASASELGLALSGSW